MKRFFCILVLLFCTGFGTELQAQTAMKRAPDCEFTAQMTAAGRVGGSAASPGAGFDNRLTGCTAWTLTVAVAGFSAQSLALQDAQDAGGSFATWASWEGTVQVGALPITATTSYRLVVQGYYPWVAVNVSSVTGTGTISIHAYGWRDLAAANMSIGNAVLGGTAGSVLFVDSSGLLGQDNSKFFWDATNHRLGIGNATPAQALDVSGSARISAGTLADQANAFYVTGTITETAQDNYFSWITANIGTGAGAGGQVGLRLDFNGTTASSAALWVARFVNNSDNTTAVNLDNATYGLESIAHGTANNSINNFNIGAKGHARWAGTNIGIYGLGANTNGSSVRNGSTQVGGYFKAMADVTGKRFAVVATQGSADSTFGYTNAAFIADNLTSGDALVNLYNNGTIAASFTSTGNLAFGTIPATTGTIRWPLGGTLYARNGANSADNIILQYDTSNNITLGEAGIGGAQIFIIGGTGGKVLISDSSSNASGTVGFLQFAKQDNTGPALKRSGTSLKVRLADDSGDAPMTASTGTFSSLTSGRVTTAGASGLLQDSANLTWASPTLTIGVANSTGGSLALANGTANASWTLASATTSNWTLTSKATAPAQGDLFTFSNATGQMASVVDVATGSVLVSGGIGAAPTYSSAPTVTSLTATNLTVSGAIITADQTFAAKTGNYAVLATDSFTVFSNAGAAGEVDFTLPTPVAGMVYTFVVEAAQTLKIIAAGSATIRLAGTASAANGNATNATVGGTIKLVATSTTKWVAIASNGTWVIT